MAYLNTDSPNTGKLILRLLVGGLMLSHGLSKIGEGSLTFIKGLLVNGGFPTFFAYGVYVGEIIVPILLIIGLKTRISAAILAVNMVFVILLAHTSELFSRNSYGAIQLESIYFYLFTAVALVFLGAGRYSVDRS